MKKNCLNKTKITQLKDDFNTGFIAPKNYFDTIENSVIAKLQAEVLYTEIPDTIPKNYFDDVEKVFFKNNTSKQEVLQLKKIKKVTLMVAALLVLYFSIKAINPIDNVSFSNIASEEIEFLIDTEQLTISNQDLAFLLEDTKINFYENTFALIDTNSITEYLYTIDLENYIDEN